MRLHHRRTPIQLRRFPATSLSGGRSLASPSRLDLRLRWIDLVGSFALRYQSRVAARFSTARAAERTHKDYYGAFAERHKLLGRVVAEASREVAICISACWRFERTWESHMMAIDRRTMLKNALLGAFVTAAGVTAVGDIAGPIEAEAFPAAPLKTNGRSLIEEAQGRPRRRWVCWWSRGRRRCGWRWV